MRIGIVTYDFDPSIGGLGAVAKQVKLALERLFPADTYTVISPSPRANEHGSSLAALRWRKAGGCPIFSLMLYFRLPALIRKHRLDLLHVHAGSGGIFLLRKPPCPLVVTAHHTYLQEAEIVFKNSFFKLLWKKLMAKLEKRTYRLADKITCVSKDTANFLTERYAIPRHKVTVIENAVRATAPVHQEKKDLSTILFIGRLEERKGIWTLLRAMEILHVSHPQARLRLIGGNLIGERLEKFIAKKNLQKVVTMLGYVHDPFMQRELASATMLVIPSLLEGFGLVAADALMRGTCTIVSDAPGLRCLVRDHETGLVFDAGDPVDCARAMAEALNHPALRFRMAEKGREDAIRRFSIHDRARDLHSIIEQLLYTK